MGTETRAAEPEVRDAATVLPIRAAEGGFEIFCVKRTRGGFMGGAVVFPGGKLDPDDSDPSWIERTTPPDPRGLGFADDPGKLRGLAVAACREALEEATLLPVKGEPLSHADLLSWRSRIESDGAWLAGLLAERSLVLDLGALHPLARWITPASEPRRFDTRFFLWVCDRGATGVHDGHEVTDSFWATPAQLLRQFEEGAIQLAPPTQRTLEVLTAATDPASAVALAAASCLDPICPKLVPSRSGDAFVLVLPGDPDHDIKERRCPGLLRFELSGGRFRAVESPA
jgi:8-oxo-dGTP pyrophosphatase MutT (NUDIX family)